MEGVHASALAPAAGYGGLADNHEPAGEDLNQPLNAEARQRQRRRRSNASDEEDPGQDDFDDAQGGRVIERKSVNGDEVDDRVEDSPQVKKLKKISLGLVLLGFLIYFSAALYLDFNRAIPLLVMTLIVLMYLLYMWVRSRCGAMLNKHWTVLTTDFYNRFPYAGVISFIALDTGLILYIVISNLTKSPSNLISLIGYSGLIFACYVFSNDRKNIKWRPIIWGLNIQVVFGLLILRTDPGYQAFHWLGNQVTAFLDYSSYGATFLFGDMLVDDPPVGLGLFAFSVLPVIIYFSAVISALYYFGVMQFVIMKMSWLLSVSMGTSATESLSTAGNIFVGQSESPLLVKPFIKDMTCSEIHAIMCAGFSTIAGSVLAAYVSLGISASYLISASVMSAPTSLAISKLMYPETEESKTKAGTPIEMPKIKEATLVEALSTGIRDAIPLVVNVAAMLLAFIALLNWFDAVLGWFGSLVDYPSLSFENVCGYALMPLAWAMGVPWSDAREAATLLGTKTFINEFVAYTSLSELIAAHQIGQRAQTIVTYALCGFANFSSIGIQLGCLIPLAPTRKTDIVRIAPRAMLSGTVATFLTACLAGVLTESTS